MVMDESEAFRESVQDVARDVVALQTMFFDPDLSQSKKHANLMALLQRAPKWTLFTTMGMVVWRWQRLERLGGRGKQRRIDFPRDQLLGALGAPVIDPTLPAELLDTIERMFADMNDPAVSAKIEELVADKRSPNALLLLFGMLLELGEAIVSRSPMLRGVPELVQREAVEMERDYLSRF